MQRILLPSTFEEISALTTVTIFGTPSRGLHARCLRFVITVARVLPYDHARLDSGAAVFVVAGGDFHPRVAVRSFGLLHEPPLQPGLSWRTSK
jgi:hypothetical protein